MEKTISRDSVFSKYKRNNYLFRKQIWKLLPGFLLSNLTTLLFIQWDGIIVGNVNGKDSLAAVSVMTPINLIIAIACHFISYGIYYRLSEVFGNNDSVTTKSTYKASFYLSLIVSLGMTVVQIPIIIVSVSLLNLGSNVLSLFWIYAIPIMISTPFSFICSIGTYILTANGKSKELIVLSLIEGIADITVDFILVVLLNMGIVGAGIGTLVGVVLRMICTVYFLKKVDFFIFSKTSCKKEMKTILKYGYPKAITFGIKMLMSYFLVWVISDMLGVSGVTDKSVIAFCWNILIIISTAISNVSVPIIGIKYGAGDLKGGKYLQRESIFILEIVLLFFTAIVIIFPGVFFRLFGYKEIAAISILSLQIAAFEPLFSETQNIIAPVLTINKKGKYLPVIDVVVNVFVTVPLALLFRGLNVGIWIWSIYPIKALVIMIVQLIILYTVNKENRKIIASTKVLYLSTVSSKVTELIETVSEYFSKNDINPSLSNKIQMCMEEMSAYERRNDKPADIEFTVTFSDNLSKITMIDNADKITGIEEDLITDKQSNTSVLNSLADKIDYQRKLELNILTVQLNC